MRRRTLTEEESRAWARVASTIRPIGAPFRVSGPGPEADRTAGLQEPAPVAAGVATPGGRRSPAHAAPPVPADVSRDRRVVRGRVEISATFDLHGHSQASAARALPEFLLSRQREGARCVLVITGKGRDGEGVLRRNFLLWLETQQGRSIVSAYARSHRRSGGDGAFYVFLRRRAQGLSEAVSRNP